MGQQTFEFLLLAMSALAVIVFVALYYVRAGYGMFHTPKWGLSVNNKLGWVLMEAPVFLVMLYLWWNSSVRFDAAPFLFFARYSGHKVCPMRHSVSILLRHACFRFSTIFS